MSLKALAERILQGNRQGNRTETKSFLIQKPEKPESFQVSSPIEGNQETADAHQLISETIADIDRAGRLWPRDYYATLPTAVLERLKGLMHEVEAAALADDINATAEGLAEYRAELLRHLH